MTSANGWNSVELRDNRYNQIVHMVSAANGAEEFYSTEVSDVASGLFYYNTHRILHNIVINIVQGWVRTIVK